MIAVCGKGGVGKTSLSALIVRLALENPDRRVLAIDADPAVGLASALGVSVHKTVDDIRNDLIARVQEGKSADRQTILSRLDYELFSALKERDNLAFLAIGRPEKEGCYCQVNHILKDIIADLSGNFDVVVIDGEAGIEQVNRRVMEKVTHLLLVSDASARGLNVARTIKDVSDGTIDYEAAGLIVNRVRDEVEMGGIDMVPGLDCLGWIPEDDVVRRADMAGTSLLDIKDPPALGSIRKCLAQFGLPGYSN